jgi:hypothetical protein
MDDFKWHPILFSGEMIRAIMDGRKTQTRRMVRPPIRNGVTLQFHPDGYYLQRSDITGFFDKKTIKCRYGQDGDALWVKETYMPNGENHFYSATLKDDPRMKDKFGILGKWTPSIFMRRYDSRINLFDIKIRVERLQDISQSDAQSEGAEPEGKMVCCQQGFFNGYTEECCGHPTTEPDFVAGYRLLWERINGDGSWNVNPWVWVISWERAEIRG